MSQVDVNREILRQERLEQELASRQPGALEALAEEVAELRREIAWLRGSNSLDGEAAAQELVDALDVPLSKFHKRLMAGEDQVADMQRSLDALHDRVRLLEGRKLLFVGEFADDGRVYERGCLVSSGGSLWHADEDTSTRPCKGAFWSIVVRRGRDSRPEVTP